MRFAQIRTVVDREIDIAAAAGVMRDNQIGYLTDRDIVVKVMAKDVDRSDGGRRIRSTWPPMHWGTGPMW